jgi:hypothetical protein
MRAGRFSTRANEDHASGVRDWREADVRQRGSEQHRVFEAVAAAARVHELAL